MEFGSIATYCCLQLWMGRGQRVTDLARGNGITQESLEERIQALQDEITLKEQSTSDQAELELREARIQKYRLQAVQETKQDDKHVPNYDDAYRYQMLSEFHDSLRVSSSIAHVQELLDETERMLKLEDGGVISVDEEIVWSQTESCKKRLGDAAQKVRISQKLFWIWSHKEGAWKQKVIDLDLDESSYKFELRVYDSMAASARRTHPTSKLQVLNLALVHQFGPDSMCEIPVMVDGHQSTPKVYLIALRPRYPVIDNNSSTKRPRVRVNGKQHRLKMWKASSDIQMETMDKDDMEHVLYIGCNNMNDRDFLTRRILQAGAKYAFAVGFSEWGREPYNYQDISTALRQSRKGDMIRLRGDYTVYNEQVLVKKGCTIVGDGPCVLVNRKTQNQPSLVAVVGGEEIFLSNLEVRSSDEYVMETLKQENTTAQGSGHRGPSADGLNVFGNGAIEIMRADAKTSSEHAHCHSEDNHKDTMAPHKDHNNSTQPTLKELERRFQETLKPQPDKKTVSAYDTLFPATTLLLWLENKLCPGALSNQATEEREKESLSLMQSSHHGQHEEQEHLMQGGRVVLDHVTITDSQNGVYVHNNAQAVLHKCQISMCKVAGLMIAEGGNVRCSWSMITNNQQWGAAVYGEHTCPVTGAPTPSTLELLYTMIERNQSTGVACWGRARLKMDFSTSCRNGGPGIDIAAKEIRWPSSSSGSDSEFNSQEAITIRGSNYDSIEFQDLVAKFDVTEPVTGWTATANLEPWEPKLLTTPANPLSTARIQGCYFHENKVSGVVIDSGSSVAMTKNCSTNNQGRQYVLDHAIIYNHKVLSAEEGWRFSKHSLKSRADPTSQGTTGPKEPPEGIENGGNFRGSPPGMVLLLSLIHI
eukprot:TRINITY_DN18524_c0_g1_i1.p1 TRINITY_DN18524_c0_g1~~TRINITY_DN18524_c0_g1_i1.p1  ORF type:complete len:873 (+),score=172.44 TRINITY_DN18524_c0_g1_i1:68-2686(+)